MSETKTNLREAEAIIKTTGILSEKNLEEVTVDGKKVIRGTLVIQTSEENFTTYNVYVNELKNDGTENSAYKGVKTVLDEYKSIAEVGREEADYVSVGKGRISPNTYFRGGRHDNIRYQTSYFNRFTPKEDTVFGSEFSIEMFIKSIVPEMAKDEEGEMAETGRVVVNGWIPTYNGIEPIALIAPVEDDIAEGVTDSYEVGQTVEFYGNCVNSKHVEIIEKPVKIGKPKREEKVTYKNEFIITGASDAFDAEEGRYVPYDADAINAAITERDLKLKEMEEADKKGGKAKSNTGTGVGSKPPVSNRKLPNF